MDSFLINVKYEVGSADIDTKGILTSALQKTFGGWNSLILFDYGLSQTIQMEVFDSKYENETYKVTYNHNLDEYDKPSNENEIYDFVYKNINKITFYTYRSIHSMDLKQKTIIIILSIIKK